MPSSLDGVNALARLAALLASFAEVDGYRQPTEPSPAGRAWRHIQGCGGVLRSPESVLRSRGNVSVLAWRWDPRRRGGYFRLRYAATLARWAQVLVQ